MNMFARFDENPAMTLRVIKETKRYGRTDGRKDGSTAREDIVRYFTKIHCGVSLILLKLIMWGLH